MSNRGRELLNTLSAAYGKGPGEEANAAFSALLDYVVGLETALERIADGRALAECNEDDCGGGIECAERAARVVLGAAR